MDLETYKSVDAEIWFVDKFCVDTQTLCVNFEILIFVEVKVQISLFWKNFGLWHPENHKNSKFKKLLHNVFASPQNIFPNQI